MAGMKPTRWSLDTSSDRGQLVVITGLVIAVVLVGLVVLVNTAIYTENLATRNPDVGDGEALEYADTVRTGIGGVIDRENDREHDQYGYVTANVTATVETLDATLGRTYVERGVDGDVNESSISYGEGRLVRQTNESRQFKSAIDLLNDWDIAHDVNDTRAFRATVDDDSLASTTDDNLDNAFHVAVVENATGNTTWEAYVYENSSTNEVAIAVENDSESQPTERCSVAADTVSVDFTAGTLGGEPCPGFVWAGGDAPNGYDVGFRNADAVTGTYNVTIGIYEQGILNTVQLNDDPEDEDPYYVPAVYDAEVEITYRTSDLWFGTEIRVAPGEPDA